MSETELQQTQRISNQRADALDRAHERIKELQAENAKLRELKDHWDRENINATTFAGFKLMRLGTRLLFVKSAACSIPRMQS